MNFFHFWMLFNVQLMLQTLQIMANDEEIIYESLQQALLTEKNLYTLQKSNLFENSRNIEIIINIHVQNISECIDGPDRAFECKSFNRTCHQYQYCCDTIIVFSDIDQSQLVAYLESSLWIIPYVDVTFFSLIRVFFHSVFFDEYKPSIIIDLQIEYLPYNPLHGELSNAYLVLFSWVRN